jgi:hypothetical protein
VFDQEIVARHIQRASEAMQWGKDDCCRFVRAIVLDHGGPDIMAGVPDYGSESEAKLLLARKGGLVRFVMNTADAIGAVEHFHPFPSDKRLVGIVPTPNGPALAIMVRGRWVVRAGHGVVIHPAESAVMAWEV